jgi:uncharacterized protein
MKLLFWLLLFVVVYFALRKQGRAGVGGQQAACGAAAHPGNGTPEAMLQCRQCGVHFPASEAVSDPFGDVFCSDEHLRLFSTEKSSH